MEGPCRSLRRRRDERKRGQERGARIRGAGTLQHLAAAAERARDRDALRVSGVERGGVAHQHEDARLSCLRRCNPCVCTHRAARQSRRSAGRFGGRQPAALACGREATGGAHARGGRDRGAERPVRAVHRRGRGLAFDSGAVLCADRHASRDLHVGPRLGVAEHSARQHDSPARVAQHPPDREVGQDDRRGRRARQGRTDAPARLFVFGAYRDAGRRDDLDGDRGRLERAAAGDGRGRAGRADRPASGRDRARDAVGAGGAGGGRAALGPAQARYRREQALVARSRRAQAFA
ncbi:regulatory proteins, IclR [Burkholderia cenocepacia PC184]|nr:regulatory proteins, IclR [Burkholderia cenocepacia PC184]